MEQLAPKYYAVEHDTIGLQLGTLNKQISRVLVTLDVTEAVVDEAIALEVDLIIAHHAIIFRPLAKIDTDVPAGRLYEKLIKHNIAVYISHTNLDVANGGVNDLLANVIGMEEGGTPLEVTYEDRLSKLVVFTPSTHIEQLSNALWHAGAGHIGKYSHCSFQSDGIGTFMAGLDTNPHIGEKGNVHREPEVRLETIVKQSQLKTIVQVMKKAHPYEEVAYDVIPLSINGEQFGLGRVAKLKQAVTLEELATHIKQAFSLHAVKVVGDLKKPIKKAAVLGGMGAKYVKKAKFSGADVIVTGDIDFHTAQDALADGMSIIDAGHHIEHVMIKGVSEWLSAKCLKENVEVTIIASAIHTDPFHII